MNLNKVLDYDEVFLVAQLDADSVYSLYRDSHQAERFVFAGHEENWKDIGNQLDAIHGGKWRPVGKLAKDVMFEKVTAKISIALSENQCHSE